MHSNDVINFEDLLKKIYKYKYYILLIVFFISSSVYVWEINKKILYKHSLRIYPLSIVEFEKNFPNFSFNKREFDLGVRENIDSLYSLNFSPLNFLYSFKHLLKENLIKQNSWDQKFIDTKTNSDLIFDTSNNLNTLLITINSDYDDEHVKKFLNLLFDQSNMEFKKKLISIFTQQIESYSKKIESMDLVSIQDNIKKNDYQFEIKRLNNLLKNLNSVNFVTYNFADLNSKNNKIGKLKILLVSIIVSFLISLLILIFLPDKKS